MGKKAAVPRRNRAGAGGADESRTPTKAPAPREDSGGDSEGGNGAPSRDAKIAALPNASLGELRAEWRRLFGTDPPSLSRDLLARAIAYRFQERAFGGLSRASLRRLEEISGQEDGDAPSPEPTPTLRSGARLVREWHGRAHVVTATDIGFDYAGSSYGSLSEIAKIITGAHWSGPRFFGLRSRKPAQESDPVEAPSNGGCDPLIDASDPKESAHG